MQQDKKPRRIAVREPENDEGGDDLVVALARIVVRECRKPDDNHRVQYEPDRKAA